METNRAIRIHEYGGPEVLRQETIDVPVAKHGEVVVRVDGAGVNPVDWKIRAGYARSFIDPPLPVVLGTELAGTVVALGPGVSGINPGDEVFGLTGLFGAYARYAAVPAGVLAPCPQNLDVLTAASVSMTAQTAWVAITEIIQLKAGQRILIHAAAGGVGQFALQLAHRTGAHVICTCSAGHIDRLKALGADEVIDYTTQAFEDSAANLDAVLDLVGGDVERRSVPLIKEGGILAGATAPPDPGAAAAAGVRTQFVATGPDGGRQAIIRRLFEQGTLQVAPPIRFRAEDVAQAHQLSQGGHAPRRIVLDMQT
jgi:NADPH:quinone reductase-like Zn-dependent oxidoreductase